MPKVPVPAKVNQHVYRSVRTSQACAREHARQRCYGTRSPLKNIRARGRIIFLFFRAPRGARAENQANQQCHFKSSRWRIELLDTDSCRGTVPTHGTSDA